MMTINLEHGWAKPKTPENEAERLAALRQLGLLDTPPEAVFDEITRLASQICGVPIALISLVDENRQWFKAAQGLPGTHETPRDVSFCAHAVAQNTYLEVPDTARDERFRQNPLVVNEPHIRFYAGVLLRDAAGHALGTLCVLDREPRKLDPQQRQTLERLAGVLGAMFEWRRAVRQAGGSLGELLDESFSQIYLLDPQTLRCVYGNQGALVQTGYTLTELQQLEYGALYPGLEREALERDIKLLRTGARKSVDLEAQCRRKDGSTFLNRTTYQFHANGAMPMISVIGEDVTDRKRVGQELQTYVAGLTAIISMQQDIAVSAPDLERLMRMIVVRARQITGARGAAIEMVEGDRLVYRAGTDDILPKIGLSFPQDGSLPGAAIRDGKALRCNETQADPRVNREESSRLGIRSMVVAPFYRERKAAGVLTVFSGEPHAFTEQTQQLVQLLATTLGSAMQRLAAEQAILEIARGATIETGRGFFKTLVSELAGLLSASYVFVGEIDSAAKDAIRIVALNAKGEMKEGIRYALHGTPCENVMEAEPFTVPANLKARFPDDRMFDAMDVESYSGVPLLGSDREPIGLLGAMFGEPLNEPEKIESTLHIFAARAASELERQHTEKRLRNQTGLMQSVLDSIADGVVVVDSEGQLVMANPAARRIVGQAYPQGESLNGWPEHLGIYGPDGKTPYRAEDLPLAQALRGQSTDGVEMVVRNRANPDGVAVNVHGRPLYAVEGDVMGGVAVLRDVTQLKRSEEEIRTLNLELEARVRVRTAEVEAANRELELRNREARLLNELMKMMQSCVDVEEGCKVVAQFAPQLFPELSGALYLESAAKNTFELRSRWSGELRSDEAFGREQCWALRRGQLHAADSATQGLICQHVHPDGKRDFASMCAPLIAQGNTVGVLYLEGDPAPAEGDGVSRQRLASTLAEQLALALANIDLRETLRNQSIRDSLTGLFNRRFLEESLNREIAIAQRKETPLALLMIDADHFKRFNDDFGHDAGDYVLEELGRLLGRFIRESDVACRFGGEEFVLLLPGAALADATAKAKALLAEVRKLKLKFEGRALGTLTVSIGLASCPEHAKNADDLFQAADAALYSAKEGGRDRLVVSGEKSSRPAKAGRRTKK